MSIQARRPSFPRLPAGRGEAAGPRRASAGTRTRALAVALLGGAVVVAAAGAIAFGLSGVDVAGGGPGLAQVHLGAFAGTLTRATARDAHGASVPVAVHRDAITPLRHVAPGATLTVEVRVHRPAWTG